MPRKDVSEDESALSPARSSRPEARWTRLSDYFLARYGEKVHKIPLDAGFSCPNRDGTLATGGCVFCNARGSGTGLGMGGLSLAEQWSTRREPLVRKGIHRYLAYLQSFSNTYGPIEKLAATLEALKGLPGITGIAIGTRPDCVDEEKIALIARVCEEQGWSERWLELGVQSSNDTTLRRIRRGHDIAAAEKAARMAAAAGLSVCVHLIAGLPGETKEDFLQSTRWAAGLMVGGGEKGNASGGQGMIPCTPFWGGEDDVQVGGASPFLAIHGVKFHALYVCRGAELENDYAAGTYTPITREDYADMITEALTLLRPDIVIQRITGDPMRGELVAPDWAGKSLITANLIASLMEKHDLRQGQNAGS